MAGVDGGAEWVAPFLFTATHQSIGAELIDAAENEIKWCFCAVGFCETVPHGCFSAGLWVVGHGGGQQEEDW